MDRFLLFVMLGLQEIRMLYLPPASTPISPGECGQWKQSPVNEVARWMVDGLLTKKTTSKSKKKRCSTQIRDPKTGLYQAHASHVLRSALML
jgi:hypothetical protein